MRLVLGRAGGGLRGGGSRCGYLPAQNAAPWVPVATRGEPPQSQFFVVFINHAMTLCTRWYN
jgi:hypothetical protein